MKKILSTMAVLSLLLVLPFATLRAQEGDTLNPDTGSGNNTGAPKKGQVNVQCMQDAVTAREDALATAWQTYSDAVIAALEQRQTDIVAAWGTVTNQQTRVAFQAPKAAFQKAFNNYKSAIKAARSQLKKDRTGRPDGAWAVYNRARIVCGFSADNFANPSLDGQM